MEPNTQDITWLDEMESELDHRMVQYLTGHHEGYRTLLKEQSEILKQYPVITKLQEGTDGLYLTPKEHRMFFKFRSVQTEREALERKYFYLMGQADMIPYKQVLQGLSRKKGEKKTIHNPAPEFGILADGINQPCGCRSRNAGKGKLCRV